MEMIERTVELIERTLEFSEDEYDTLEEASNIIKSIINYLDDNTEVVADKVSPYSYDDVKQVLYFLNEMVDCTMTIEKKEV